MSSRAYDPARLDVAAFATDAGRLEGRWPLKTLHRVVDAAAQERPLADDDAVAWSARGERRAATGGTPDAWLHLRATAALVMQCQRCLGPVDVALDVKRSFRFVHGEDAAAQIDASSEEDVLAMTRALDLRELIEDELVLAMPLVPLHDVCPIPLPIPVSANEVVERDNPFAALATLKSDRRPS
jgi:uncharacterized protein